LSCCARAMPPRTVRTTAANANAVLLVFFMAYSALPG
jgi:hypothetical protein